MREVLGSVQSQVAAGSQTGKSTRDAAFIAAVAGSVLLMGSSFVAAKVLFKPTRCDCFREGAST
jgi:hypothetical protein